MSVLSLSLGKKTGRLPERRRPAFPMVALALLFSLLALLPLGFVVAVGFDTGWPTIKALVFRPRVGELLSNTLWLTVLTVPISIVLGVTLAWLTERIAVLREIVHDACEKHLADLTTAAESERPS